MQINWQKVKYKWPTKWLTTSTQIYYYLRMYALEYPSIRFVVQNGHSARLLYSIH